MDINISGEAQHQLEEFLLDRFDLVPPLRYSQAPGGRSNRGTHLVVTDSSGVRVGLKYVSGHYSDPRTRQNLLPTENIVIAAELSRILDAPSHIEAEMVGPIAGLGPLDGLRFAARRWHGEAVDEVKTSIEDHRALFLEQYGEWVALGLLFSLADGKPEHWTWDISERTVGRCDLELLFFEEGKVTDYLAPLKAVEALSSIKTREGPDFEAFSEGVRAMVEKFHARRGQVDELLQSVDEHTRAFLKNHTWALLMPGEFIDAVLVRL